MTKTLSRYIGLKFLTHIIAVALGIFVFVMVVDFVEALREVSKIPDAGFTNAALIVLLRSPRATLELAPFVFLVGTIWTFAQLGRNAELAVIRAAGVSIWAVLAPCLTLSLVMGALLTMIVDPAASYMSAKALDYKNELRGRTTNLLQRLDNNIWLRSEDGSDTLVIHASSYNDELETLEKVVVWRRSENGEFKERWDARHAFVKNRSFLLQDVRMTSISAEKPVWTQQISIPSPFTMDNLIQDARRPESMSLWEIPAYLDLAEQAGLPSRAYQLRLFGLISLPFTFMAMVLIAATFSLGHARSTYFAQVLLIGLASGFVYYVISEIANAFSIAGLTPPSLAVLSPTILAVLFALHILLKTEEG